MIVRSKVIGQGKHFAALSNFKQLSEILVPIR